MKSIIKIVNTLKPSEKQFIKNIYNSKVNKDEQKRFKLFLIALEYCENKINLPEIFSGKTNVELDTFRKLYKSTKDKTAFSHLKSRLKNDILSYLLIHDSSNKKNISPMIKAQLECERITSQGLLLLRRGLYKEAEKELNKALKIAIKYEIFPEIIRIKTVLRRTTGFREGEKKYDEYNKDLNYYLKEYTDFIKVQEYYEIVNMSNHFNTNKNEEMLEKSKVFCEEMDKIVTVQSSDNFMFFYYSLKSSHHINLQEFEEAIKLVKKLQDLVANSHSLNMNSNKSGLQMVLSKLLIQTGKYAQAQEEAKKSVNSFRDGMINQLRAMEILFFSYLRANRFDMANETIDSAMKHKQYKSKQGSRTFKARWTFYKVNVLYLLNEKEQASKLLSQNTVLAKDRSGWELGHRILELMMRIDENAWDIVAYNKDNFYKLLNSLKKNESNIFRALEILNIIRMLAKSRGDFKETSLKVKNSLDLLEKGNGKYYWDPTGFEVVRFDSWFRNKVKL